MKIYKGEKVATVGKSGSGKSTLIRMLLGLINPTSGSIINDKYVLDEYCNVLDNFSVLNQNCLIFNESLRKNLDLYTDYFDSERLINLIDRFGLGGLFHDYNIETRLDSVSGGEQKRIGLLRTLLRESNIYVFDELSNSLDNKNIDKALNYIKTELSDKTVIMVDHRTKDFDYFDNIYVLEEGMIVAKGSFEEIKSNEAFISIYNYEEVS